MTLMEVMVALAILALSTALAFSQMGGWLAISHASASEAQMWRDMPGLQVFVQELAAGVVDPQRVQINAGETRARVLIERLSPQPFEARLTVQNTEAGARLLFSAPEVGIADSVLFETDEQLRFSTRGTQMIVIEAARVRRWNPLVVAPIAANAPLTCAFDPISRSCR
jgi:hypothetical protein